MMAAWAGGAGAAPSSPPSDKLAEALSIIARAQTRAELDAVGKGLGGAGLSEDELCQARDAFRARGSKLRGAGEAANG